MCQIYISSTPFNGQEAYYKSVTSTDFFMVRMSNYFYNFTTLAIIWNIQAKLANLLAVYYWLLSGDR